MIEIEELILCFTTAALKGIWDFIELTFIAIDACVWILFQSDGCIVIIIGLIV